MSKEPILGEEAIIARYLAPLAAGWPGAYGLADDCATIAVDAAEELVVKTDPIVEGVHFLPDTDPADIAWRALAVNVSDIAAKGAIPVAYLMALSLPRRPEPQWLERFSAGLAQAQAAFGCHLIGGDTDRVDGRLAVGITMMGRCRRGAMIRRSTARPGDIVLVTGTLGDAALGLALKRDPREATRLGLSAQAASSLIARYLRPLPRLEARPLLLATASAAMDLSDGLAKDLARMARTSGVGARIEVAQLPLSRAFRTAMARDPSLVERALSGGDDYELLITVPRDRLPQALAEAAAVGLPLAQIGAVRAGAGVEIMTPSGAPLTLSRDGYDHFV